MNFRILLLSAPVLLAMASVAAAGGPFSLFGGGKAKCGGAVHCDKSCDHCPCYPTIEEVTVKKPCFEVECEQICVPKVRLPWPFFGRHLSKVKGCDCLRGCSGTQCGHTKTIRVLKVESYECIECQCNWDVNCKGKGGHGVKGYQEPLPSPAAGDVHEAPPANDVPAPPPMTQAYVPDQNVHNGPAVIQVRRVSNVYGGENIIGR